MSATRNSSFKASSLAPVGAAVEESVPRVPQRPHRWLIVAVLAIAALPLLLLIDTIVAFARGWQTQSRLDFLFIACLIVALGLIVLAVIFSQSRAFLRRQWAQMILLVAVSVGTWLATEAAAALYRRQFVPLSHLWTPSTQQVFNPKPGTMPGIVGESRVTINSLGIRGPELPPDHIAYRILCIGGSTTECIYLDDSEAWPHLLMHRLNHNPHRRPIWVGNVGRSGFSSDQHLGFLDQDKLAKEMDCVVLLVGANDFLKFLGRGKGFDATGEVWERRPRPVWRRSRLLDLIRKTYHAWNVNKIAVEDTVGSAYVERRKQRQAAPVSNVLPDLVELDGYRDRLRAIVHVCRAKNVRLVFLTQPILYDSKLSASAHSLLWAGWMEDGKFLSVEQLRKGLDQYNNALQSLCRQLNVECVDLTTMNGQESFFYDDVHFNEAGAQEVARLVAEGLLQHPPN